ncbi:MAG: TRAP transporter large permease subunit, partial [Spirochaetales bacterium]|nr:TRAP transporter large permease subunit [Spirochaetales bacterium]
NYPCTEKFAGFKTIWKEFKINFWAILLPVLILICLTVGIGTVTEIGAVSCVFAAFISMVIYKELDWKGLWNCIKATARQVAVVFAMLAAATVFIWIIGSLNFQNSLAAWIGGLGLSRFAVFMIAMLIIFILGMVLETLVITMIFIPVLAIPCIAAGVDPYVFAVAAAMVCAMGLNTPPVGTLLYLTASIADTSAMKVAKESIPFIICVLIAVVLLGLFPQITLWYPSLVL